MRGVARVRSTIIFHSLCVHHFGFLKNNLWLSSPGPRDVRQPVLDRRERPAQPDPMAEGRCPPASELWWICQSEVQGCTRWCGCTPHWGRGSNHTVDYGRVAETGTRFRAREVSFAVKGKMATLERNTTRSRTITGVKQCWARLELGWEIVQGLPESCC